MPIHLYELFNDESQQLIQNTYCFASLDFYPFSLSFSFYLSSGLSSTMLFSWCNSFRSDLQLWGGPEHTLLCVVHNDWGTYCHLCHIPGEKKRKIIMWSVKSHCITNEYKPFFILLFWSPSDTQLMWWKREKSLLDNFVKNGAENHLKNGFLNSTTLVLG